MIIRKRSEDFQAKLFNDTEMARAKRDFELKKATYDIEVTKKMIYI